MTSNVWEIFAASFKQPHVVKLFEFFYPYFILFLFPQMFSGYHIYILSGTIPTSLPPVTAKIFVVGKPLKSLYWNFVLKNVNCLRVFERYCTQTWVYRACDIYFDKSKKRFLESFEILAIFQSLWRMTTEWVNCFCICIWSEKASRFSGTQ